MGTLFGLLTAISWAIGIFPFTGAARLLGSHAVNSFRLLLATLVLGLLVLYLYDGKVELLLSGADSQAWLWLGLSGVVGLSLGDFFSFKAFENLGARNSSVFTTMAPGAAMIFGSLLIGETFSLFAVVAMLITVAGILILQSGRRKEKDAQIIHPVKGAWYATGAALCQGIGIVLARKGMLADEDIPSVHAAWIRMFAGCGVLYIIELFRNRIIHLHKPIFTKPYRGLYLLLAGTLFGPVIGVSLSLQTARLTGAGVAQTLFTLVPVFTLPLAWWMYGQRISLRTGLAVLVSLCGVLLLVWENEVLGYLGIR